jgi:hypothetical protein
MSAETGRFPLTQKEFQILEKVPQCGLDSSICREEEKSIHAFGRMRAVGTSSLWIDLPQKAGLAPHLARSIVR